MLFNAGLDLLVYWIEAAPLSRKSCLKFCRYNTQKSHQYLSSHLEYIKAQNRGKGKTTYGGETALMGLQRPQNTAHYLDR